MLDGFHILTLTHRDAPLRTIAHAILPEESSAEKLGKLKAAFGWEELMYLATCNRATYIFYAQPVDYKTLALEALRVLRPDLPAEVLQETAACARLLQGADAVSHVLELASSMDSLVVGEREILRQLRVAYDQSRDWGLTGDHLRLLIRFAIETAKDIYTNTAIGEGALSVVALAFNAMLEKGIGPKDRILLIGAGQTNTLFGKFLAKNGFQNVTVFNRNLQRAEMLARLGHWKALPLSVLDHFTEGFDALVVCTASVEPLITPAAFEVLLAGETTEKTVVDLSLPHNVAVETTAAFPIQYIEIETLKEVATENLLAREQARESARSIIAGRLSVFCDRWHERQLERMLAHIPEEVRAARERATQEVFAKQIAQLDGPAQALLLEMMDYMEKKCVAIPMKAAKAIVLGTAKRRQKRESSATA